MSGRFLLDQVSWCPDADLFESWRADGIKHGFLGIGGRDQGFHHVHQVHGISLAELKKGERDDEFVAEPFLGNRNPRKTLVTEPRQRKENLIDNLITEPVEGLVTEPVRADGIVTQVLGAPLAIKTADCLPALFWSRRGIAAVHAGWRGLTAGILNETLLAFRAMGVEPHELRAGLGPCISLDSFEVGPEVVDALESPSSGLSASEVNVCLMKGIGDRWHVDLQVAAVLQLCAFGMQPGKVSVMRTCTLKGADRWHSYRRSGRDAGRNWSWIELT